MHANAATHMLANPCDVDRPRVGAVPSRFSACLVGWRSRPAGLKRALGGAAGASSAEEVSSRRERKDGPAGDGGEVSGIGVRRGARAVGGAAMETRLGVW